MEIQWYTTESVIHKGKKEICKPVCQSRAATGSLIQRILNFVNIFETTASLVNKGELWECDEYQGGYLISTLSILIENSQCFTIKKIRKHMLDPLISCRKGMLLLHIPYFIYLYWWLLVLCMFAMTA